MSLIGSGWVSSKKASYSSSSYCFLEVALFCTLYFYRDQEIRRERNKTAWMEWMATKQNEKVAHKKKQEEAKKVPF